MPLTRIPLDRAVRERLKTYGTAGMTYNQVLTRLVDATERDPFIREIQKEADATRQWTDVGDL